MPDKKLTDNEIRKALECISGKAKDWDCDKCAFDGAICTSFVAEKALDLINRLQAENERLKTAFDNQMLTSQHWKRKFDELAEENDWLHETLETTKAEAYKEFADKVKKEIDNIRRNAPSRHIGVVINYLLCLQQKINNLLKEMGGEDNG